MKYAALLIIWLLVPLASWATSAEDIFNLMRDRLTYMKGVALYKFDNQLPLLDQNQEKIVLEKAVAKAEQEGLNSKYIEGFFTAQMSAAKAIQYGYMADWMSDTPDRAEEQNLKTVIRPALLKLGAAITENIADYLRSGREFSDDLLPLFERILNIENLSTNDKKLLFRTLQDVRLKDY